MTTTTTTTTPKPRRERIREVYKSIISDYMVAEQWRATFDSYYKKQKYWNERRLYDDSLPNGEYPATLPQTESQLLRVIQHSGYPELRSRKTVRRCLDEMVKDGVLYRYQPDVRRPYNQKLYAFPLKSMPSRDVILFFEIERMMAFRYDST